MNNHSPIGSGTVSAFKCNLPRVATTFLREEIDER